MSTRHWDTKAQPSNQGEWCLLGNHFQGHVYLGIVQSYPLEAVPLPHCDCHIHCIASLRRVQGHCLIGPLCQRKGPVIKLLPVAHSSTSLASIPSAQPITCKRRVVCITNIYQAFTAD